MSPEADILPLAVFVVDGDKHFPDIQHADPESRSETVDIISGQGQQAHFQGCDQVRPSITLGILNSWHV